MRHTRLVAIQVSLNAADVEMEAGGAVTLDATIPDISRFLQADYMDNLGGK